MDRAATAAMLAEMLAAKSRPVYLVELALDEAEGGAQRFTDGFQNVVWNGNTFYATGYMLSFDGISESGQLSVSQIGGRLSAVDQTQIAAVLSKHYVDRRLSIWKGFWDASSPAQVVIDPIPIFNGRMDSPEIQDDPSTGKSEVMITASNQWVDFERRPGRHTSDAEQQLVAPGDRFFQYANDQLGTVVWGGPKIVPPGNLLLVEQWLSAGQQ